MQDLVMEVMGQLSKQASSKKADDMGAMGGSDGGMLGSDAGTPEGFGMDLSSSPILASSKKADGMPPEMNQDAPEEPQSPTPEETPSEQSPAPEAPVSPVDGLFEQILDLTTEDFKALWDKLGEIAQEALAPEETPEF